MAAASRFLGSVAAIALTTVVYASAFRANPTTVALTYLVVILLIATGWGIAESTAASVLAVLCLNFYFLPPLRTFTIADPQNWVALVAFLVTAIVGSQLSVSARRRALEAVSRERDLERLYALSRSLLLSERGASAPGAIARHIADAFGLEAVAIYDHRTDVVAWAGSRELTAIDPRLRDVARRGESVRDPSGLAITAIQLGGAPIGSLAISEATLSDTVLNSIVNLAAIGLERAQADEVTARAEAARESSELRATVLDALAHEFKTPLTVMKAASSDLLAGASVGSQNRDLAEILDEEVDHLDALVSDVVQMLRIDAGQFATHISRQRLAGVLRSALDKLKGRLDGHQLITRVPESLTVDADRQLLGLALRQLLDNALKYSPPSSTIEIEGSSNGHVAIAVRNSGSTIPEREQARIFERFYRGAHARQIPGTGMGLGIVLRIAQAHGGTLTVSSTTEEGTTFTLSLPRGGSVS